MSYAGIRNGLVTTIQGGGKWAASQISTCDFGIMELSASCVVLAPGAGTTIRPLEYQGSASVRTKEVTWEFDGWVFIKDPGDPTAWLGNIWTACDDILSSVNRDDSLNGQAQAAHISSISRPNADQFYRLNGFDYANLRFKVVATEWVD